MLEHFTPDAARGLAGPDWLGDRRRARPSSASPSSRGRPTPRRSGATAASASSTSTATGRSPAEQLGEPGDEPAPGGGPIAAEAGERAGPGRRAQRARRAPRARRRARGARACAVCGLATCDRRRAASRARLRAPTRRPTRSRCCTTRSSPAARSSRSRRRRGRASPIVVLHWSEGDGLASFPHTLVVAGEGAEVTVFDRFGSPDTGAGGTGHLVDAVVELVVGDNAHVRYLSVQEHGPRTWQVALQRAHLGRDAHAALVGGRARRRLRTPAQRVAARRARAPRATSSPSTSATATQMLDFRTLQDHDAPHTRSDLLFKGAVEDTAQSVYSGSSASARGAEVERATRRTATSCSPRAPRRSRSPTSRSRPTT